jgi:hypothetical protein
MLRRLLALGALAVAVVAGLKAFRRKGSRAEFVELFYEDGSLVTLTGDEAEPLLEIARSALA